MIFKSLIFIIVILSSNGETKKTQDDHPMARSPLKLQNLHTAEKEFLEYLMFLQMINSAFADVLPPPQPEVVEYQKEFTSTSGILKMGGKNILNSPIAIFLMIHRWVYAIPEITALDDQPDWDQFLRPFNMSWPTQKDLAQAIDSILRIHFFYDIKFIHYSDKSSPFGFISDYKLSSNHCLEIGQRALEHTHYALAIEWLEQAIHLMDGENNTAEYKTRVLKSYTNAVTTHDGIFWNSASVRPDLFTDPVGKRDGFDYIDRKMKKEALVEQFKGRKEPTYGEINFWALCQEKELLTPKERIGLKCHLGRNINPYFTIQPPKIEIISNEPKIVQIYDFIGDGAIKEIIRVANETGFSATYSTDHDFNDSVAEEDQFEDTDSTGSWGTPKIEKKQTSQVNVDAQRSSILSWIDDRNNLMLSKISRKMELISGFRVLPQSSAEDMLVSAFAPGGHSNVYHDLLWNHPLVIQHGDRLATFMIYLSDVEMGGLSAFPIAFTSSKPVKGSALLWLNSLKNGLGDPRVHHGDCPVISGEKWVATKWIHANDQFLRFPCSKNKNE